jgi:phytoene synthase
MEVCWVAPSRTGDQSNVAGGDQSNFAEGDQSASVASRPGLAEAYARSQAINREHGRSYYLATRLLPAHKRPHVYALYGFTRWADDIVDAAGPATLEQRQARLEEWNTAFLAGLAGSGASDPLLTAVLHTIGEYRLHAEDFDRFLRSMAMDLKVTNYATYDDLLAYMDGSAAAIGTMMLPILGVVAGADQAVARESARQLGLAFQLTNFIRDVAEDLDRGRIYLPEADLDRFGVSTRTLTADARAGRSSAPVRALIAFECRRALVHYAGAKPGLRLLESRSRVCIRAAYLLYGEILAEVARAGYDVLAGRVRVPRRRRAAVVMAAGSETLFDVWTGRWRQRAGME